MNSKENSIGTQINDEVDTHRAISIHLSTDTALSGPSSKNNQSQNDIFFLIKMVKPYFNVNQTDITERIKTCLLPRKVFLEHIIQKPDLYVPFWIFATLAIAFSLFGNIAAYLSNLNSQQPFKLQLIKKGILIFYSFFIFAGVGLSILGRGFGLLISPAQAMSLYGYSMSCCLLLSVICILPSNVLHWILMVYGFITSTFILINTLNKLMVDVQDHTKYGIFGALCLCQFALFIVIKIVFLELRERP